MWPIATLYFFLLGWKLCLFDLLGLGLSKRTFTRFGQLNISLTKKSRIFIINNCPSFAKRSSSQVPFSMAIGNMEI